MSVYSRHSRQFSKPAARTIHQGLRRRAPWSSAVALEIALLRAWLSASLLRAVERLFRFAARPTAATILEMRGWRSELPELGAIERELGARPLTAQSGEPVGNPFKLSTRRPPDVTAQQRPSE